MQYPFGSSPLWQDPPQTSSPVVVQRVTTSLTPIQSPFFQPNGDGYGATVALGAVSRVSGRCMERHGGTGMCWGTFAGKEGSTWAGTRDHPITSIWQANRLEGPVQTGYTSSALLDNQLLVESSNAAAPAVIASSSSSSSSVDDQKWQSTDSGGMNNARAQTQCKSFGSYSSSCPNCVDCPQYYNAGALM